MAAGSQAEDILPRILEFVGSRELRRGFRRILVKEKRIRVGGHLARTGGFPRTIFAQADLGKVVLSSPLADHPVHALQDFGAAGIGGAVAFFR